MCEDPALSLEDCTCKAKPILHEVGGSLKYSMNKLKKADQEWYTNIVGGTEWEILSSDMDKEEPNAAHTIVLALNDKNKMAFGTAHLEIMRTLNHCASPNPKPWRFRGIEYGPR